MTLEKSVKEAVAKALLEAEASRTPIDPITDKYPQISVDDAYEIQKMVIDTKLGRKGGKVVGMKIGFTSRAIQKLLGVNEPAYGHLLSSTYIDDGSSIIIDELIQPMVEAEVAFIIKEDIEGPGVTVADVLRATEGVMPAIEVVDSRIRDWKIKIQDTIADNASAARFVLGGVLRPVKNIDLRLIGLVFEVDGEVVSTATGAAIMGNPAIAVAWLANNLAQYGEKLHAGNVILSGSLIAAAPAAKGTYFKATFSHLGSVSVRFR